MNNAGNYAPYTKPPEPTWKSDARILKVWAQTHKQEIATVASVVLFLKNRKLRRKNKIVTKDLRIAVDILAKTLPAAAAHGNETALAALAFIGAEAKKR